MRYNQIYIIDIFVSKGGLFYAYVKWTPDQFYTVG